MLKVLAGHRQTGRTTQLIDLTKEQLKTATRVSLLFPDERSAHNFSRSLLSNLLDKPVDHNVETQDVVRLLTTLGYKVEVFLLYSLRTVLRNSKQDDLIVCDDWRCRGDAEFRDAMHMAKGRRVLAVLDMDAYRSLSANYRDHPTVCLLDVRRKNDDQSDGPVSTVDHPRADH